MTIERHLLTVAECGTLYRLRPNPDAPIESGFDSGASLEFSEDGNVWQGHFHIAPECLKDFAEMFTEASIARAQTKE